MARSSILTLHAIATIDSAHAAFLTFLRLYPHPLPIQQVFSLNPSPSLFSRSYCFSAATAASMANVTRNNFKEAFEQLKKQVQVADFVALDLEMSGVLSAPWRGNMELDTLKTRYYNLKDSAEKFQILQCGVCPFHWDKAGNKYIAHPYNFYLFLRNESQFNGQARDFLCQTSSLEFLAKHQFDFNACIYDGISYLSREQEEAARLRLGSSGQSENVTIKKEFKFEIPLTRTSDVLFCEKIRIQVGHWKDNVASNNQHLDSCNISHSISCPSLLIDVAGDHQVKLVQQVLYRHYKNLVVVPETKDGKNGHNQVKVMFVASKEEKAALLAQFEEDSKRMLEAELLEAVGFRQVIDVVADSGKPVIGHNCMLDFAHIYNKFFGPLPEDASEFCKSLHKHFPCIVDTKYLMKAEPTLRGILANISTTLEVVFSYICQQLPNKTGSRESNISKKSTDYISFEQVKLEMASEVQRYEGTSSSHEAGFDAYMTGAVFAQLCYILKINATCIQTLPEQVRLGKTGLAGYTNLLYLGWVGQLVLDLTTGEEAIGIKALKARASRPQSSFRKNVVLMWGNDSLGTVQGLQKHVKNCFENAMYKPDFDMIFVDTRSAFIVFSHEHFVEEFVSAFEKCMNMEDQQSVCARLIGSGIRVARFEMFERLCRSPLSTPTLAESAEALVYRNCMVKDNKANSSATRGNCMTVFDIDGGNGVPTEMAEASRGVREVNDLGKTSKDNEADDLEQPCMTKVAQIRSPANKRKASLAFEGISKSAIKDDSSLPRENNSSRHLYVPSASDCNKVSKVSVHSSSSSLSNRNHTKGDVQEVVNNASDVSRKKRRRYRTEDSG